MRLSKSFLAIAAATMLVAATAFAEDSRPIELMEGEPPMLLSEEPTLLNEDWGYGEQESLAESDVIYIYPMEVTEYYLIVPDEMHTNNG